MYKVEFGYYNYPRKTREFATYAAAKGFFNKMLRNSAVKRIELICS